MSATPREIGTLIVVILRANHLPNKRHIGKQDPYCVVTVNGEKRRTKAIKRGGQHPEWDEEIRFTLFEDVEDVLARTARGDGTPPPPPKDDKRSKKIKGGKAMKLACFADDPREPDFIGEADVDLTEVLTKGETDEWFTLTNKDKFAGKVYLELTFWSNEPPPEKKVTPKPLKNNKQYAGPGSFVPTGEPGGFDPSRIPSTSAPYNHSRQNSDVVPSSLRVSSGARLDLYVPPYERNRNPQMSHLAHEFGEFGVSGNRRRESFPPAPTGYSHQPQPSGFNHSTLTSYPQPNYDPSVSDASSFYSYDRPVTPAGQGSHSYHSPTSTILGYAAQPYQQSAYDVASPAGYQSPSRGPRHSIPTASSGFMPLPQASGFTPLQSHTSEPSGFAPPPSHTPAPLTYNNPQFQPQQSYPPPVSLTPAPTHNGSYLPQSTSLPFQPPQSFPTTQSYGYPPYGLPPSASAPPQHFIASPPPVSMTPQANPTPPQIYSPVTPGHDNASGYVNGQASRPLPQQPQVVFAQPSIQGSHSLPQPGSLSHSYSPTQTATPFPQENSYSTVPQPPPPPPSSIQYNGNASASAALPVPPPPPPPPPSNLVLPHRRASLPQPPVTYQQPTYQQPPPPPPPPPTDFHTTNIPLPPPPPPLGSVGNGNLVFHPGLPPKPPAPVNEHGQWLQSATTSSSIHSTQAY